VETRLHIFLIALKVLMLQTPLVTPKKKKTCSMQDQLCAYYLPTKEKIGRVGYYSRRENVKMN